MIGVSLSEYYLLLIEARHLWITVTTLICCGYLNYPQAVSIFSSTTLIVLEIEPLGVIFRV